MSIPKGLRWPLRFMWLWIVLEVGAFAGLGALLRQVPGYWGQQERQKELASQQLRGLAPDEQPGQWKTQRAEQTRTLRHPFLGSIGSSVPRNGSEHITYWISDRLGDLNSVLYREEPFIVGVLGGSVATNLMRLHGMELYRALRSAPQLANRKIHLVCLANSGHKQPQGQIGVGFLLSLGVKLDAVLALDGFNEVALYNGPAEEERQNPAYPRQWVAETGLDMGTQSGIGRLDLLQVDRAERAAAMLKSPLRYSWVRQLAWHLRDRRDALGVEALRLELGNAGGSTMEGTGPRRSYASVDDQLTDLVAIWERASRSTDQLCRDHGAVYLNFLQPNQYVPDSKPFSAEELTRAFVETSHFRIKVELGYPMLQERAKAMEADGLLMHDLTGLFKDQPETRYRDSCCHFNPAGSIDMANAMAEALLAAI